MAHALSLSLTGAALADVGRMSLEYLKIKLALLVRFRYTVEGYMEKFRSAKPEIGETSIQFATRLAGYFES